MKRCFTFGIALLAMTLLTAAVATAQEMTDEADKTQPPSRFQRIVLVLTNTDQLGAGGEPTGFWLEEFYTPYQLFADAGLWITVASPNGGTAPVDPRSIEAQPEMWEQFQADTDAREATQMSVPLAALDPLDHGAVFLVGGHGTMWDFANNRDLNSFVAEMYESGGVVSAVCHGPCGLLGVELSNGEPLVKDKRVCAFTNEEEAAVELLEVVPYSLEDQLIERGAEIVEAEPFSANAIRDGQLVTGQNPASSELVARLTLEALADQYRPDGVETVASE